MANIDDKIKDKLLYIFRLLKKESVTGHGDGWVNLVKFAPAIKEARIDFRSLGFNRLGDFVDASDIFDSCYDKTKSVPPKYIKLKNDTTSTKSVLHTVRKEDSINVEKIKKRLRLANNFFIGQFAPDAEKGYYRITDIRNTDFTKIEDKERGIKNLSIRFKSSQNFYRHAYYRFTWVLLNTAPLRFGIDLSHDVKLVTSKDTIECINSCLSHYSLDAAKKITSSLDTLSKQLTQSGKEVFIYELLQNANDYPQRDKANLLKPVDVEFHITDEFLTFQHTGAYFNAKNVAAICNINDGEKTENVEAIGYKGIGFKTVFLDSDYVFLQTGTYTFRFDRSFSTSDEAPINTPWQIYPLWTEPKELSPSVKHIFSLHPNEEFRVKFALKPRDKRILSDKGRSDNYIDLFSSVFDSERVILFVPNIHKVSVYFNDGSEPIHREKDNRNWCVSRALIGDVPEHIRERINDVLTNQDADKSNGYEKIPEKYLNFYKTAVKFACKRQGRKLIPVDDAILYCYLPAKKADWGFKFLMNTDMLPNGYRDDIEDIELNHEIAKIAGQQFFYWIKELIASKEYEFDSIFSLIPDWDECKKHRLYKVFIEEFQEEFEKLIKEKAFIPVIDADGLESLETINNIIDDRTGITEKNVMTDADFINLMGMGEKALPIQELRESDKFMSFLYSYSPGNLDIDFDDVKKKCSDEEFQTWLKNIDNNTKFIAHLLEKDELDSFSSESIFIEYENDLFRARDLYFDFDTEGSLIYFMKKFVPHLCEHTRTYFKGNEDWISFADNRFLKFNAQSIVNDCIVDNDNAIELLKTIENSVNFYRFVAEKEVDLSKAKHKLPYFNEDGNPITFDDYSFLYFYSDSAYQVSKQPWIGKNDIQILSHLYLEDDEDNAIKDVFEGLGCSTYDINSLLKLLKDDEDFMSEVNQVISDSFETNVSFVRFFFEQREVIKDESNLFKNYMLCCLDIENSEEYLCNDDLRYFNQSSYNGNSTFEDNTRHKWLDGSWMYCLSKKYFDEFEPSEAKALETFFRQQFGIETFTDKSFFENVVLRNKKDIYATLTSKDEMLPFLEYLHRDMKHIFDGSLNNNQIKDMPLLCSDDNIRVHDDGNIKFYRYDEDAATLFAKEWCPGNFAVLANVYSEFFDDSFFKLFYIDKYDLNEVLNSIIPSMEYSLKNDNNQNIDFWRWIKDNLKNIDDVEQLKPLSLLDSDKNYIDCSSLYISDVYQSEGIESIVKKYDKCASFVSELYLKDNNDKEKNDWLKLFKKLGLKFDNLDILLNSVLPNLSTFEEDAVVAMMTKHLKDLKGVWEERQSEIIQLRVRTKSGEYMTLDDSIIVDIPEESVVEPFKYISLSDEIAPDILSNNKELLRLVAAECRNHCSISSKKEWAEEKIKEYISNIQDDEERRNAIHVEFVRELAKLSEDYSIDKELYDAILYMVKGEELCYLPASEITLGSAYSPSCNFEANGVSELRYLSETYIFESNRDTIKSYFKQRGLHQTMTENDIEYLSTRAFALYFWSTCFSKSLSEYEDWITRGLFDDIECIPTETSVRKPEELYFTRMWVYASKSAGWKERVPYKSVIDKLNADARDVFDKLPFNPTLSFRDCIGYLLNATDKREDESSRRREICNWILQAEDIDDTLIASYRNNPKALWRNGKGQNKHISELYVIHPDARQHREIFRGNEFVMATSMFPFDTDEFTRLCDILSIKYLTDSDFVSTPKNKVDQTVEMMKELKPRILVLSAIENAVKYKERYRKYNEIISNYRFYVCDEIDLGYDTIHNDVVRIYEENNRIYYVTSWQHSRTFTRFCSKIKNLLDITVIDNVFEDVFDESRSIEQNIEKYCADLVYDDDFRNYLENLDCSVPDVIEEDNTPEEEKYYSDVPDLPNEEESSFDQDDIVKPSDGDITPESSGHAEKQSHIAGVVDQGERQDISESPQSINDVQDLKADIEKEQSERTEEQRRIGEIEVIEQEDAFKEHLLDKTSLNVINGQNEHSIPQGDGTDILKEAGTPEQDNHQHVHTEDPKEVKKPRIHDEYLPVDEKGEPYVPDPDNGYVMGDIADDPNYQPMGEKPSKSFRRKVAKPYTKEELNRLRSNGTPLELESLPATVEEIDILAQCGISVEQIADTNYLAQLRLYNNLVDRGEMPEESREEFVKNADDVAIHKLKDGRYIHTCSAARGVMYISPSVWNKMVDDKWKVCVYLDGRGKNFHYINNADEFIQLVEKDDVVIKITGKEKVDVVKQLYSGVLEDVKGTAYTLIRVASRTNMDAVFAHYVGAMAEADDGNDNNEY